MAVKMTAYYLAAFCFILVAVCNGKVIDISLQDDMFDDTYLGERYRRVVPLPQPKCNDWSDWINNNKPANGTDAVEKLDQLELDRICPLKMGKITKLRCIDERGEPINNAVNVTSGDSVYVYTCDAPKDGAICYVIKPNGHCPDYKISFMCTCPSTTVSSVITAGLTIKPSTTTTEVAKTSKQKSSTSAKTTPSTPQTSISNAKERTTQSKGVVGGTQKSEGSGSSNNYTIGNSNVPWWLIPVLVAAVLFIINIIIAVCLHKTVRKNRKQNVHPM